MEWRYFLSASAQSMAAVLGVFGALLVALAVNEVRERKRNNEKLRQYLAESDRLKLIMSSLNKEIELLLGKKLHENIENFKRHLIKEEGAKKSASEYVTLFKHNLSEFENLDRVEKEFAYYIKEYERSGTNWGTKISSPDEGQTQTQVERFRERYIDTRLHVIKLRDFRTILLSGVGSTIKVLAVILVVVFVIGVAFPLFLIPSDPMLHGSIAPYTYSTIKTIVTVAMFLSITALLISLLFILKKGIPELSDIRKLEEFSQLSTYSKYFEQARVNIGDTLTAVCFLGSCFLGSCFLGSCLEF